MPKNNSKNQKPNTQSARQFDAWNRVKKNISRRAKVPTIHEGEVWRFADGQNVGVEINGKGKGFARPVLILTKFGRLSFHGVPLTSQKHDGPWFASFGFQGKTQYISLSQSRTISVHRLYGKMGEIPKSDLAQVRTAFLGLHSKNIPLPSGKGVVGIPNDASIIHRFLNKFKTFFKKSS